MAPKDLNNARFAIKELGRCIVKAAGSPEIYILPISYLDYLVGRVKITIFFAYEKPPLEDHEFSSISSVLRSSLSATLAHYYPFAGRAMPNPETGVDEIHCNNEGVAFIEALVDAPLAAINFHDLNDSVGNILLPSSDEALLSVQITSFSCGGFTISWSFDHILGDAATYAMFLSSFAELARTNKLSPAMIPNHDRSLFRRPRTPPSFDPSIEEAYTECTLEKLMQVSKIKSSVDICTKRLYYVSGSRLEELRASASRGGVIRTKVQAFTAYLWKMVAQSLGDQTSSRIVLTVDGRRRIRSVSEHSLSNYSGNVVSTTATEAKNKDVMQSSLSELSETVADATAKVANEERFLDLIDFLACKKSKKVISQVYREPEAPTVAVTAAHNFPTMSVDFGFGPPVMGTYFTGLLNGRYGYVNIISSGREDGSWLVYALVWPSLAAALESDPKSIFQPFKLEYMQA